MPEARVPEIRIEGLVHVYSRGGVRALDGVNLRIRAGERVAIVGQNGSGKTTLVRHLIGLLRPTAGRVLLDGQDVAQHRVAQLAARVGMAFQDPDRQIFARAVGDEVAFGPRNLGVSGAALREAVASALEQTGLAGLEARNPYELGRARRRLLAIASVLAMRTPVLVLDEPTTGQDRAGVATVRSIVDAVAAEGRTVIAITHDLELAAECFARVVVMREGQVILEAPPAEALSGEHADLLRTTNLERPHAARVASLLGIRGVATERDLVEALVAGSSAPAPPAQ